MSGNLSFLNWLTILPSIACFDDYHLKFLFSKNKNSSLWKLLKAQQHEKMKFDSVNSSISIKVLTGNNLIYSKNNLIIFIRKKNKNCN